MENTINLGDTCRLGKSKNGVLWTVIGKPDAEGMVSLSKLGGDGYVNKTAHVDDMRDVQPNQLETMLWEVLAYQEQVRGYSETIKDRARFFKGKDEVARLASLLLDSSSRLQDSVNSYHAGVIENYPEIAKKEGLI